MTLQKLCYIIVHRLSEVSLWNLILLPKAPKMKTVELANSIDSNEVAHEEPPHLDLHCLPFSR